MRDRKSSFLFFLILFYSVVRIIKNEKELKKNKKEWKGMERIKKNKK